METVKHARKTMRVLLIIPICFCVLGIVGYFLTDKSGIGAILGLLSCWTIFSAVIVSQAEGCNQDTGTRNRVTEVRRIR